MPGLRPARRRSSVPASGSAPITPRTRKSPCSYSGLPPSMTIPSSSPLATSACWSGSRPSIASRSVSSAGRPGELADDVALGRGDGQLGADGRRALRDARHDLDAREGAGRRRRRRTARRRGTARRCRRACARWRCRRGPGRPGRAAPARPARGRSGTSRGRGAGRWRSRRRARACRRPRSRRALGDVEVEGLRAAVAERRGPHRDRGAALDLAPGADARRRRRSRRATGGASASCTPSSVASGAARCVPEAKTQTDVGARAPERRVRLLARLDRREARVGAGRQPAADAHAHRA